MKPKRAPLGIMIVVLVIIVGVVAVVVAKAGSKDDSSKTQSSDMSSMDGMDMHDGSMSSGSSSNDSQSTDSVTIESYAFGPKSITVKAGTTVTWTNQDSVHHTITSDSGSSELNSPEIGKGETFKHTFSKPGTYTYHCMPHPYMHGTVTVTK